MLLDKMITVLEVIEAPRIQYITGNFLSFHKKPVPRKRGTGRLFSRTYFEYSGQQAKFIIVYWMKRIQMAGNFFAMKNVLCIRTSSKGDLS